MIIYQVYVGTTAVSEFFKTKKKAKQYIKDFYNEYLMMEKGRSDLVSMEEFAKGERIEIIKIRVK